MPSIAIEPRFIDESIEMSNVGCGFLDKQFWADAFDKNAPFYDDYVKYFSKGIAERNPNVLDVHREAIYYTKDHALVPIIVRLIKVAEIYPDSSFVESLAFFLSRDDQRERLKAAFSNIDQSSVEKITRAIDVISARLIETGDDDLAEQLKQFQSIIKENRVRD